MLLIRHYYLHLTNPVLIAMISIRGFFLILGRDRLAPPCFLPLSFLGPNTRIVLPGGRVVSILLQWYSLLFLNVLLTTKSRGGYGRHEEETEIK